MPNRSADGSMIFVVGPKSAGWGTTGAGMATGTGRTAGAGASLLSFSSIQSFMYDLMIASDDCMSDFVTSIDLSNHDHSDEKLKQKLISF